MKILAGAMCGKARDGGAKCMGRVYIRTPMPQGDRDDENTQLPCSDIRICKNAVVRTFSSPIAFLMVVAVTIAVVTTAVWSALTPTPPLRAQVTTSSSGDQYFLKIDGVVGEATTGDHLGEIPVRSVRWNQTRTLDSSAKVLPQPLTVTILADSTVPQLLHRAGRRERSKATLTMRNSAGQDILKWTFTDAGIIGYDYALDPEASSRSWLTLQLSFTTVTVEGRKQLPNGGLAPSIKGTWDMR